MSKLLRRSAPTTGSIEVSSSYRPLAAGLPDLSQAGREQFTLKTLLDADVLAPARQL
jgi:hypothetical protein